MIRFSRKGRGGVRAKAVQGPARKAGAGEAVAGKAVAGKAQPTKLPKVYIFASQRDESVPVLDRWLKFVKICTPHVRLLDADSTREETVRWLSDHREELEVVTIRPPEKCPLRFAHDYFNQWVSQVSCPLSLFVPLTVRQLPAVRFNRYPPTAVRGTGGLTRNTHIMPFVDPARCRHSARAAEGVHERQGTWQARVFRPLPRHPLVLVESDDSRILVVGQSLLHPSAVTDSGFHATTTGAQFGLHPHLIVVDFDSGRGAQNSPNPACAVLSGFDFSARTLRRDQ